MRYNPELISKITSKSAGMGGSVSREGFRNDPELTPMEGK